MARARRSFAGRDGPKRMTEWSQYSGAGFAAVSAGGATLLSTIAFESPGTLIRTRGLISIKPQSFAADVGIVGAFGIAMVSAEAAAVGITALPEPHSDADWGGWMVLQPFAFHYEFQDGSGGLLGSVQIEVDSKAMRKVGLSTVAIFIAEGISGAFNIADESRLLLKLH